MPASRTISNIATIAWDVGGQRVELPSNRVDIDVAPSTGAVLETLRLADGIFHLPLLGGTCSRGRARPRRSAPTAATPAPLSSYEMIATSALLAGRPLDSRGRPPVRQSRQPVDRDAPRLHDERTLGDREEIVLIETSADSGRFIGIMLTTTSPPGAGDCRLSMQPDEALTLDAQRRSGRHALRPGRDRHSRRSVRHRLRQPRRHAGLGRADHPDRRRHRPAGPGLRRRRHFELSGDHRHRPERHRQRRHALRFPCRRLSLPAGAARADTGCSSSRSRLIPRPRPRLPADLAPACGGPTACPSPSSPAPMAARSRLRARRGADRHSARPPGDPDRAVQDGLARRGRSRRSRSISPGRAQSRRDRGDRCPDHNRSHSGPDAIANRIGSHGWGQGTGSRLSAPIAC